MIFLSETSSGIGRFDKSMKSRKEIKKRGLHSDELLLIEYKTIAAIPQVKVNLLEETLHQKLGNIHIEKVIKGYDCSIKYNYKKTKVYNSIKERFKQPFCCLERRN